MKQMLLILTLVAVTPTYAQHQISMLEHKKTNNSVYAGMQTRTIKALSDQQVSDMRAGKGMGVALPAELNGYPGPGHTLELADALGLTEAQKTETKMLFEQMQNESKELGEKLIASENELDKLFKDKQASNWKLEELTNATAKLQGQFRFSHLRYHVAMLEILSSSQVDKYNELRGYK